MSRFTYIRHIPNGPTKILPQWILPGGMIDYHHPDLLKYHPRYLLIKDKLIILDKLEKFDNKNLESKIIDIISQNITSIDQFRRIEIFGNNHWRTQTTGKQFLKVIEKQKQIEKLSKHTFSLFPLRCSSCGSEDIDFQPYISSQYPAIDTAVENFPSFYQIDINFICYRCSNQHLCGGVSVI